MKFIFFDTKPYDKSSFEKYVESHNSEIEFKFYETKLNTDTVGLATGFDGVCIFVNDEIDAYVIDRLYEMGVKIIALRCAGYNNVDIRHAFGKIHVVHVPAYSPHAVAEHAMALLLTSIRRTHRAYNRTKDFNFSLKGLTGFDLHEKTVGIVGTGKIGQVFVNICRGFGMNVLAYDKYPLNTSSRAIPICDDTPIPGKDFIYVELDELYSKSDIISFHCPLTEDTHHMVNVESVEQMKKGVVIINTSRGALIDTEALISGIKSRKIGAACLDVYEEESDVFFEDFSGHIVDDDTLARLISLPNVILTSHQAFLTEEALANIAETTCKNIVEFFETGTCQNELCYRCGNIESCRGSNRGKCF